ncbi:DUF72 domain-containing protein [Hymenobacter koreensis]|uniref:DUF72 domain-containing protein n=1 Tax=Hymenobacter koreensis TaxID=1084523 RepID=A0ABP8ITT0_9BACT
MNTPRIGCSGFHYRDWKGVFYPPELPPRKWFGYYCTQFNALELNVTFYKMPELRAFENWYEQSPEGFRFAVKAPRIVTHYKKFSPEAAPVLADFYGLVREGLREKVGPILFQLPPKAAYTEELFGRILGHLDPSFSNALEFRHPSWWEGEVLRTLAQHNISFVGQSHPLPLPDDVVTTNSLLYYRLHGVPELYKSSYSAEYLTQLAADVQAAPGVKEAYVFFNNGIGGAGVLNAQALQRLLR